MGLRRHPYRPSSDQRVYCGTGKDPSDHPKGELYRFFANALDEAHRGGATADEVYHTVGYSMGLTQDDIIELLKSASEAGYLEYIR